MVYKSPIAIHPGETLKDILESFQMSQKELAQRTSITEKHISNIINGLAPITPETALKLEILFDISASFFNNLQSNYEETKARIEYEQLLSKEEDYFNQYFKQTYSILKKFGFIEGASDTISKIKGLHKYFGTASLNSINEDIYNYVYFRKTNSEKVSKSNIAAWIRAGELAYYEHVKNSKIATFEKKSFSNLQNELQAITIECKSDSINLIKSCLTKYGIVLVTIPYFEHSYVNGLTRRLGDTPLIQISDRNKCWDIFLFTLYHELGHVMIHGKKAIFLEYDKKIGNNNLKEEDEANAFAGDTLINSDQYKSFVELADFTLEAIKRFATQVMTHYTVVLGRVAHDINSPELWKLYNNEKERCSFDI